MWKLATPTLPESLILSKWWFTWVKFEGYKHLSCQLYLPKIYQSLKLPFSVFTTDTIGTSFFTTVMAIFFDNSMTAKTSENLCFGKGNILFRSAVYHKTNIKIYRKLLSYFILASLCNLTALGNASVTSEL